MTQREGADARPPVWVGHVTMATPCVAESRRCMETLGLRPIADGDGFAVLELRGGTHLVLLHSDDPQPSRAPFETHARLAAAGLSPAAIAPGRIHRSFTVTDPSGREVLFNSSHVSDRPV